VSRDLARVIDEIHQLRNNEYTESELNSKRLLVQSDELLTKIKLVVDVGTEIR